MEETMKLEIESNGCSRRDWLRETVRSAVAVMALSQGGANSAEPAAMQPEMQYALENDYPFFGGELPEAYQPDASSVRRIK